MKVSLTNEQKGLLAELSRAVGRADKKLLYRLVSDPRVVLRAWHLKALKRTKELRVRTFWGGRMDIVFPERVSQVILRRGYFEADVCQYMIRFLGRGMTFLDIGAHLGFFTLLASYLVRGEGRVVAFEPSHETYQRLNKNITNNCECVNARAFNCAAYSEDTEMRFYEYGLRDSAFNSMFGLRDRSGSSVPINEVTVKAKRVDDVLATEQISRVDMIKIDAESSEMHVLKGLRETLASDKPAIILEVGDFGVAGVPQSKEIVAYLLDAGYATYEVCEGEIVAHRISETYGYGNLLFFHEDCLQW